MCEFGFKALLRICFAVRRFPARRALYRKLVLSCCVTHQARVLQYIHIFGQHCIACVTSVHRNLVSCPYLALGEADFRTTSLAGVYSYRVPRPARLHNVIVDGMDDWGCHSHEFH